MIRERLRVSEWRITTHKNSIYTVRYWIECDPEHGGIKDYSSAHELIKKVEKYGAGYFEQGNIMIIAMYLLENIKEANSVEVCTKAGNGIAVHRDWP